MHAEKFRVPHQHERSLDFLVGLPESPQEHSKKARGTLRSLQQHKSVPCTPNQLEMRPGSPALALEPSCIPPSNTTSGLSSFRELQRFPEYTFPSLEEHQIQHSNSRKAPCTPNHLEMRADSQVSTQEEYQLSTSTSRGGFSQL